MTYTDSSVLTRKNLLEHSRRALDACGGDMFSAENRESLRILQDFLNRLYEIQTAAEEGQEVDAETAHFFGPMDVVVSRMNVSHPGWVPKDTPHILRNAIGTLLGQVDHSGKAREVVCEYFTILVDFLDRPL